MEDEMGGVCTAHSRVEKCDVSRCCHHCHCCCCYYYYYYICYHLYAGYLQLYTWNKPCF